MDRLKDFLYDKNDIILTLVILLAAGMLIAWRMDVIMQYPQILAKETHTKNPVQTEITEPEKGPTVEPAEPPGSIWENGKLTSDITVTIPRGSAKGAVNTLISAGLFESYEEYSQICASAGCVPENIKAATFTFPKGCTQKDIARKVTQ